MRGERSMSYLAQNLALLAKKDKTMADAIAAADATDVEVIEAKDGLKIASVNKKLLHSAYHPEKEGAQFISQIGDLHEKDIVVFGFGYGYHLSEIVKRVEIDVIEPNIKILKSAFINVDLYKILPYVRVHSIESFQEKMRNKNISDVLWLDHQPSRQVNEKDHRLVYEEFYVRRSCAKHRLKVLVIGPHSGGSLPTAGSSATALLNLGCDVDFLDYSVFNEQFENIDRTVAGAGARSNLHSAYVDFMGLAAIEKVREYRPDIVLALAQAPLSPATIEVIKKDVPVVAFWFVENHRTLPYWENVAGIYDYFFTIQKGEFLDKLTAKGSGFSAYVPQGADVSIFYPETLSDEDKKRYGARISFMGAGYPNRHAFFARLLDLDFTLWGTGWESGTLLSQRVKENGRRLDPSEYKKIFLASQINLNLHSSMTGEGIDPMKDFVNPRTFEVPACGAFSLVDMRDDLPDMFDIGKEIITFGSLPDLREKIEYFSDRPERMAQIATAGRARILKEHRFENRMSSILYPILERDFETIVRRKKEMAGPNDVKNIIQKTGDEKLAQFLLPLKESGKISFAKVRELIAKGEGDLSREEILLLLVDQIVKQDS